MVDIAGALEGDLVLRRAAALLLRRDVGLWTGLCELIDVAAVSVADRVDHDGYIGNTINNFSHCFAGGEDEGYLGRRFESCHGREVM